MFEARDLSGDLSAVRTAHAPGALVVDCARDFETLDPAVAEELALLTDALDPATYPESWLPADAPDELRRYAGDEFTVGMPGDGGVAWTRQTDPPTVFVKPRLEGSPESFVRFLVAEALLEAGSDVPEHFLPFFESRYRELASAVPLDPAGTYQLAAALTTAYTGLHTRETFVDWDEAYPDLFAAWLDAGERLVPRLTDLPGEVARGETAFPAAAELACSAVKHAAAPDGTDPPVELPAPFAALDTSAYRDHGAEYAVTWAEKTFAELDE
ncbi:DUF7089 family protein [Halorientalis litorea]|jgi:hypothetical protein|uniref:DUF7089 family protein n=1 Tax=Halorientalis litorea TaxID=2931977 RepID=UPI001FF69E83|nr:hypothetical protein [Halorientalis litorea]